MEHHEKHHHQRPGHKKERHNHGKKAGLPVHPLWLIIGVVLMLLAMLVWIYAGS